MNDSWIKVCDVDNVQPDAVFAGEAGGKMIAIYCIEGSYFATDNICPHAYALLSDGWLEGQEIECPLHGARFDVKSGALIEGPAECGLKTYPVRVKGDEVFCQVSA